MPPAVTETPKADPTRNLRPGKHKSTGSSWTKPAGRSQGPRSGPRPSRRTRHEESRARTGRSRFRSHAGEVDGVALLARSAIGDRLGIFQYDYNLTKEASEAPARIVVKPGREVVVHVTDMSKVPVPDAAVEVAGRLRGVFDDAKTGPDGSARLLVPVDAKVEWIFALKSGQGFDYAEFGRY